MKIVKIRDGFVSANQILSAIIHEIGPRIEHKDGTPYFLAPTEGFYITLLYVGGTREEFHYKEREARDTDFTAITNGCAL